MGDYLSSDEDDGEKQKVLLRKQKELEFQNKLSQEKDISEIKPSIFKKIIYSSWFAVILTLLFLALLVFLSFR
jgi:hypothetical protein